MKPDFGASLVQILPELVLTGAILLVLVGDLLTRKRAGREVIIAVLACLGLAGSVAAIAAVPANGTTAFAGMIATDGFALFFKGLVYFAAFFGVLLGAMSNEIRKEQFGEYVILLLCLAMGMGLLAAARNLLMIYLALEMVSLPSYILTGFRRGDRRSSEAAVKYVIIGAISSGLMLYGFSLLYGLFGSLDLGRIGQGITAMLAGQVTMQHLALAVAALLSLAGFAYKVAAVPFHMWCPDVYEGAPTPFTAFLSVGPKAAGMAALLRFFLTAFGEPVAGAVGGFPWPVLLGILAMVTMTVGNLAALNQENVKRMLAYSSIAHAGYMMMAVAVGSRGAIEAVMLYMPIYLLMNTGAFLAVMAVRERNGSELITAYRGLGTRSPFLAITLAIFLFSLTGIPPFAGFIGKFYLFAAVLKTGTPFFNLVAVVGVLNSVVALYYYARIVRASFLDKAEAGDEVVVVTSPSQALLTVLAVPTLVLGIWWGPLAGLIERSSMLFR
jgi:NADH-quinone oxidoreductase subunit N